MVKKRPGVTVQYPEYLRGEEMGLPFPDLRKNVRRCSWLVYFIMVKATNFLERGTTHFELMVENA